MLNQENKLNLQKKCMLLKTLHGAMKTLHEPGLSGLRQIASLTLAQTQTQNQNQTLALSQAGKKTQIPLKGIRTNQILAGGLDRTFIK